MIPADAPLALIGFGPPAARALRDLGLSALSVPDQPLSEVLSALHTLNFGGALLAPRVEAAAFALTQPDGFARKLSRVDALSLMGEARGTHTLEEALARVVEESGYALRGARLLVIGEGASLRASLGLARLGAASVTVAAPHRPEAQGVLALLPGGVKGYAVAAGDAALESLAERADLVVLAGGALPEGVLHPFHTLLDLTGEGAALAARLGVPLLGAGALPPARLALQLEHATGQRFGLEALREAAAALA